MSARFVGGRRRPERGDHPAERQPARAVPAGVYPASCPLRRQLRRAASGSIRQTGVASCHAASDASSRRARRPCSPAVPKPERRQDARRGPTRPLLHVPSLLPFAVELRREQLQLAAGCRETPASSCPRRRLRRRWRCGSCTRNRPSPPRWRYSGSRPRPCRSRAAAFLYCRCSSTIGAV